MTSSSSEPGPPVDSVPDSARVIRIHLRELSQFFDSMDPSPFHEKDLDRAAEEYIVDSYKELHSKSPCLLVLDIDQAEPAQNGGHIVEEAIRVHFRRRAGLVRRNLRSLIRRGLMSLVIGLTFLAAVFVLARIVREFLGPSGFAGLLRESLLIVGWVAMWRPLEIFLYDWWPILGEYRILDRLSRMAVRINFRGPGRAAGQGTQS